MAQIKRTGFGQVEPNHLTGIVDGSIYAQLPAAKALGDVLEQGRFAKYDYAAGEVDLVGDGPWLMIYNEEKLYDERRQNHKDFALQKSMFTEGVMTPRLIEINIGDIFTTNTFGANTSATAEVAGPDLDVKAKVYVDSATGYLSTTENTAGPVFQVAKVYTMPDGQPGVKLIRIA